MRLTWVGHSTVLVETGGVRVLADPLLRNRTGLLRRFAPLPDLDALGLTPADELDVVVLSHLHHDHADLPSLRRLRHRHLVVPPGAAGFLARHGVAGARELPPGGRLDLGAGVSVTAVPAEHLGRREPWGPSAASVGHLVSSPEGTAWLAGDTGLFEGMRGLAGLGHAAAVDVAAVPVWGWGPTLGPGHLDPVTAVEAVGRVGARHAVPVHWGTLHPLGLRRLMRTRLTTPGPRFVAAVTASALPVTPHLLDVGDTLTLPARP